MNYVELLALSLALAVDAATCAFSYGLSLRHSRARSACILAAVVGAFQAAMPLLGYVGGVGLHSVIESWGRWLVLLIFAALGLSVLYKAFFSTAGGSPADAEQTQPWGPLALLLVGLATSMDAFAVGICLSVGSVVAAQLSPAQLLLVVAVIGLVTFVAALLCFHLSRLLRHLPEKWLQAAAGLLLLALGLHQL